MKIRALITLLPGALLFFLGTAVEIRCQSSQLLTDLGQVRSLTSQAADAHRPVDVTVVVSYYDPVKSHLFVQDATAAVYVYARQKPSDLKCGEVLHIRAETAAGDFSPILINAELERVPQPLRPPDALAATVKELLTGRWDCRRVVIEGDVRSAVPTPTGAELRVLSGGREVTVQVRDRELNPNRLEAFVESSVRVTGVCGITADTKRRPRDVQIYSCGWSDVLVLRASPTDTFARAVTTVSALSTLPLARSAARVHLRGKAAKLEDSAIVLRDPTGSVRVEGAYHRIHPGQEIDVVGFPAIRDGRVVIEHSLSKAASSSGRDSQRVFSKVVEIRSLAVEKAAQGCPVQLRGVVTYCSDDQLFIQDETGGIFVRAPRSSLKGIVQGDLIDLQGRTDPGRFAPIIVAETPIRVIGKGSLPEPEDWSPESLLRGNLDCQWIEVSGVVFSQNYQAGYLELVVATRQRIRLTVKIESDKGQVARDWTDAAVTARGVCESLYNDKRQLTGVALLVPDLSRISVTRRAPADPFAIPIQSIVSLRGFSPNPQYGHRVHVRGIVTASRPPWIFVHDQTGALMAFVSTAERADIGEEIEVIGFPISSGFAPFLEQAIIRKTGAHSAVQPLARQSLSSRDALEHDAELVRLEARMIDVIDEDRESILVLGSPHGVFYASLLHSNGPLPRLRAGSLLGLTGICSVRVDELRQVRTFRLLLRSPKDVLLLSQPPWWTLERIVFATGSLALLLVLFVGWTVTLKRKLIVQTQQITHRLELEAEVEKGYRDLLENAEELIQNVSLDGNFLYVNPAWRRRLGYDAAEVKELVCSDVVAPANREAFTKQFQATKEGRRPDRIETVLVSSTGEQVPVIGSMVRQAKETGATVQAIFHDISERKKAELALRQSEERFATAFHASPVAIVLLKNSRVIDANGSLLRIMKAQREDVIGRTAAELGLEGATSLQSEALDPLGKEGSVREVETSLRDRSGSLHTVIVRTEVITLGGEPCTLAILDDITEKLRLENELRQAQKLESIGQLAAGIAHDFNNLLTIIRSNASLLLSELIFSADQRRSLQQIVEATTRAANLTRHLLTFGQKQSLKGTPLDVNSLITDMIPQLRSMLQPIVELCFEPAEDLPSVNGDTALIAQCLRNLVSNARDAMPKGGILRISTESVDMDQAAVRTRPEIIPGSYVRLTVSDSGVGMDQPVLSRVFDPFFTTKEVGKGTGLGLTLVYGVVKQHRGWVDVVSAPARGSTFRVHLPGSRTGPAFHRDASERGPVTGSQTLLVVEDEELIASLARRTLESRGYGVLVAPSGDEALRIWQKEQTKIALVISDLTMPGMNGYELLQRLRTDRSDLKAILCSGLDNPLPGQLRGKEIRFLPKPYDCPTLLSVVGECLGNGKTA